MQTKVVEDLESEEQCSKQSAKIKKVRATGSALYHIPPYPHLNCAVNSRKVRVQDSRELQSFTCARI